MSPHESPRPLDPDAEAATLAGNRETLTPAGVRSLLRECVTVVKPGEVLVIRVPWNTSQWELREYAESLQAWNASHEGTLEAVVVPAEELGIAEARPEPAREKTGTWLDDVAVAPQTGGRWIARHAPSGLSHLAPTRNEAIRGLADLLVARNGMTVNEAREGLGMKPWPVDAMVPPVDVT